MCGRDGRVPISAHGDVQQHVDNDSTDHIAGEDGDKEPTDIVEPLLNEDTFVEEN